MIKEVKLPDLGEGIEGASVSEVPIAVGDAVSKDDVLFVLESDKASMEIPSEFSGTISEICVSAGDEVQTNDLLLKIEMEELPAEKVETKKESENKNAQKEIKIQTEKKPEPQLTKAGDNVFASPGVRRLARELEIDLRSLVGSGSKGRITKDDLHGHIKLRMQMSSGKVRPPKKAIDFSKWGDVEVQKLTKVNRITGARLQEAWQEIPHVTQQNTADITDLDKLRKELKEEGVKKGIKVTLLPFLMKAVVMVLREMPRFNSSLDEREENLVIKNYYHMGVAVDTPSGLMVPSIKNVDKKTIFNLSEELMDISERARNKKLKPEELKGSSFTISSLGGVGGTNFSPIVNPPEVAILGVSKGDWKPVYDKESNSFVPKYQLPFSVSYDHRVIDGASGAAFTERLSQVLGDPGLLRG